jgi:hypothetical protein
MLGDEIKKIFLSSTAKDCNVYRKELKEALEKGVPVTVHLQEDWAGGAALVMTMCRDKIVDQDGYIGLFGHRYGWIPEQSESAKSITHLEWEWAIKHWTSPQPPIFIFLPLPGREADQLLKQMAEDALQEEYSDSESERQESLRRQKSFLEDVRGWARNRFINFYETAQELREKGSASINHWNRDIWKQALQVGEVARVRISDAELGAIGRDEQVGVLEKILPHLRRPKREVAAAFVVHGEENHGQRHFANFLAEWEEWEEADQIYPPSRPDQPEDPAHLARWACGLLGQPVALDEAMESLVSTLAARLEESNVVVFLQSLGEAADRWSQFSADFWKPLQQQLGHAVSQNHRGSLYWFVVDHEPCPYGEADIFNPLAQDALDLNTKDQQLNTTQLIPMPQLRPLKMEDVDDWLKGRKPKLNGERISYEKRAQIAMAVTRPDGIPVSVFERLMNQGSWEFPS